MEGCEGGMCTDGGCAVQGPGVHVKVVQQDRRHEAVQFYLLNLGKNDFERLQQ